MNKERLEDVLGVSLSDEDVESIKTYYLKFYNNPENYVGTELPKIVLLDIGKTEDVPAVAVSNSNVSNASEDESERKKPGRRKKVSNLSTLFDKAAGELHYK